ncbi:MAG: hypothetical protein ABI629_08935 [bacterium]
MASPARSHRFSGALRLSVLALGIGLAFGGTVAAAQPAPFGLGQDLRLNGIVDPLPGANTLGTIKVRAGDMVRNFGVLRAQTPQVEGMSLFNRSSLHPEQLLLRGDKAQLETFRTAPPGSTLNMLGRYQRDNYLLASIELVAGK